MKIPPKVATKPPITPARSKQALMTSRDRDPVQVYCRIRPLDVLTDDSCVSVLSDSLVQVVPPENSQGYRSGTTKVSNSYFDNILNINVTFLCLGNTIYLHWCI